jgi:hypothetical protein
VRDEMRKEEGKMCKKGGEMAMIVRDGLGLDLGPLFIAASAKGALNGPYFFTEDFRICYLK